MPHDIESGLYSDRLIVQLEKFHGDRLIVTTTK
jgi:hypothetical protein